MLTIARAVFCSTQASSTRRALSVPSPVSSSVTPSIASRLRSASSRPSAATTKIGNVAELGVAIFSKPTDRAFKRAFDRILRESQFADGLRRIEPHLVTRHPHAFKRHVGFAASDVDRPDVLEPRVSLGHPVRNLHRRGSHISHACEHIEDLFERDVAAAEDVAFADSALLCGKYMAFGAIAHIDQVHPGVDVAEHLASEKIDDDLAGRRRLDIEFPDRSAWIDNYNRQSTGGPTSHFFFSEKLAAFVVANHIVDRYRSVFVCRRAVVIQAETPDRTRIDDPLDLLVKRRLHKVVRAFDVALIHLVWVFGPEAIISSAVINNARAFHGLPERIEIAQVSGDEFYIESFEVISATR